MCVLRAPLAGPNGLRGRLSSLPGTCGIEPGRRSALCVGVPFQRSPRRCPLRVATSSDSGGVRLDYQALTCYHTTRSPPSWITRSAYVPGKMRQLRQACCPGWTMRMDRKNRLPVALACLALAACGWLREGPSASDIDGAVRRALDAANKGELNALAGGPLPTSDRVASVKPDGDCAEQGGAGASRAFTCNVSIVLRHDEPGDQGTTLHAELQFAKDSEGRWQTSDIDRAMVVGTAKSLIDQASRALSGQAASNPQNPE
jgi:hypothetical protein